VKEAHQYIKHWMQNENYSKNKLIIVLEPGLGYLLKELYHFHPKRLIFSVFFSQETFRYCNDIGLLENIITYTPDMNQKISGILDQNFGHLPIRNISFMEWSAAGLLFPADCLRIRKKILDHLKIMQGNEMTKNHFSQRWLINGIRNFIRFDYSYTISSKIDLPVILASSGPSLERHIQRIKEFESSYIISALPSSLSILKEYGIVPDLLFTTDPGFYAREHLKFLDSRTICIAPITASFSDSDNLISGINQDSFIESLLFRSGELPFLPEMGTVAASALLFLKRICNETIYIAGMDFCIQDIKMHAEPHSFSPYILNNESRLNPGITSFFNRATNMASKKEGRYRFSKNMDTYAAWFRKQSFDEKVFRLEPVYVDLPINTMKMIPSLPKTLRKNIQIKKSTGYPKLETRMNRVSDLRKTWIKDIQNFKERDIISNPLEKLLSEYLPESGLSKLNEKDRFLDKMDRLIDKVGSLL
jgi:hypothetical protein